MSKVLVLISPLDGHFNPFVPILNELISRGHNVVCIAGKVFKDKVEKTGAVFSAYPLQWDYSEGFYEFFPEIEAASGLKEVKLGMKLMSDVIPSLVESTQSLLKTFDADLILYDSFQNAGGILTELGGPPCIAVSVFPIALPSDGVAPFGMGLLPGKNWLSCWRNNCLTWLIQDIIFRDIKRLWNRQRQQMALPPMERPWWSHGVVKPNQFLYMCAPAFEYPRANLPDKFQFIGTVKLQPKPDYQPPPWWPELAKERPVVLINQGTVAKDLNDLIKPAIEALKNLDVTVIAVPVEDSSQLGSLPANTFIAPYVPFGNLLPQVDLLVANGGFGSIQNALAHGIPVVVGGATEDKMEVAARVEYSGTGINLRSQKPTPAAILKAVQTILANPSYKQNAQRLQAEYLGYDPAVLTVDYVEAMVAETSISQTFR